MVGNIEKIVDTLSHFYGRTPMEEAFIDDPFQFLAAVMLSAKSRDSMTIPTAKKLFALAPTPDKILAIPTKTIEGILHPIGFYRVKTKYLQKLSAMILEKYAGKVPDSFEELVSLPGVSRKVANVIIGQLFGREVIAVDTHVHRISNRLGWAATVKPKDTEKELRKLLPKKYWRATNGLLVQHGQRICLPLKPKCEICPVRAWCPRIGVR